MNPLIPGLSRTPKPVLFGERYKSQPAQLPEAEEVIGGLAVIGTLGGGSTVLGPAAGSATMGLFTVAGILAPRHPMEDPAIKDPVPPTAAETLQKSLESLDEKRKKQQEIKENLLKTCQEEVTRLESLREQLGRLPEKQDNEDLKTDLERSRLEMELSQQEQSVKRMQSVADAAIQADIQLKNKMQELKKSYLTLLAQLQQIEQNKKILEMQKTLESLKTDDGIQSPPKLEGLKQKIEDELNTTTASVDAFLLDANALGALHAQEQAEWIDRLKTVGGSAPPVSQEKK